MGDSSAGPRRNRVTPIGDIEAFPLRGAWTGNRGVIHRGHDIVRFHAGDLWITCALEFRGRWREQWLPNRWTHLYFHDEAVSFAAGHRPCAECRRASYLSYRDAWAAAVGRRPSATEINRQLHAERLFRGTHRRRLHQLPWSCLPAGAFVLLDETPALTLADHLALWSRSGYQGRKPLPKSGVATVITPPSTITVLQAGYPVQIDPAAL
ncbi:hypothetical protein [Kutzneria sp. NPDC052558]|uniref:hypothetical protein n=1 Tax=Kutzneria sp. NPDC052558 TaxID=3364121 RepID=UPI0037CB61EA